MNGLEVLRRLDWHVVLLVGALAAAGVLFIHSATLDDPQFASQDGKQVLFLAIGAGLGGLVLLVPYARVLRLAPALYVLALLALLMVRWLGVELNGARRWYRLAGFQLQPSEFAKLLTVVMLAAVLRWHARAGSQGGWLRPFAVAALPAGLVLAQPDLGSSLVFWPPLFAMCYVAGMRGRTLGTIVGIGCCLLLLLYLFGLHDYQQSRIDTWLAHFGWDGEIVDSEAVRDAIRGSAWQPWQSLIAIGSGGWSGFGLFHGPQNRFGYLPYRSSDYLFAVVAEETGWLGAALVLLGQFLLAALLLAIALRTRERFGRLLVVGVATWLFAQSWMHVAVCAWMLPAKGLPMPLLSAGGSATIATLLGIALALNVGARREPVLAGDGFD